MNNEEWSYIRSVVSRRLDELNSKTATPANLAEKLKQHSDDSSASLDLTTQSEVSTQIGQVHQLQIRQLTYYLTWLEQNQEGLCEECGEEIPYTRLLSILGSKRCVKCEENING